MAHIAGSSQISIRLGAICDPVRLELPDEQQHLAAAFPVMDIPLPSCGIFSCRALALPVEQALVDGIVVIHGRWRIVLVSLIERHKEHIQNTPEGIMLKCCVVHDKMKKQYCLSCRR